MGMINYINDFRMDQKATKHLVKNLRESNDTDFRENFINFTDEGNFEKRQYYANFLRSDVIEQTKKDNEQSGAKCLALLDLTGPKKKTNIWKPDKFRPSKSLKINYG